MSTINTKQVAKMRGTETAVGNNKHLLVGNYRQLLGSCLNTSQAQGVIRTDIYNKLYWIILNNIMLT
jgi:hypothetical protein